MDDVVFAERQAEIDVVPAGAVVERTQGQIADDQYCVLDQTGCRVSRWQLVERRTCLVISGGFLHTSGSLVGRSRFAWAAALGAVVNTRLVAACLPDRPTGHSRGRQTQSPGHRGVDAPWTDRFNGLSTHPSSVVPDEVPSDTPTAHASRASPTGASNTSNSPIAMSPSMSPLAPMTRPVVTAAETTAL